jgi:hypothetical protein
MLVQPLAAPAVLVGHLPLVECPAPRPRQTPGRLNACEVHAGVCSHTCSTGNQMLLWPSIVFETCCCCCCCCCCWSRDRPACPHVTSCCGAFTAGDTCCVCLLPSPCQQHPCLCSSAQVQMTPCPPIISIPVSAVGQDPYVLFSSLWSRHLRSSRVVHSSARSTQ